MVRRESCTRQRPVAAAQGVGFHGPSCVRSSRRRRDKGSHEKVHETQQPDSERAAVIVANGAGRTIEGLRGNGWAECEFFCVRLHPRLELAGSGPVRPNLGRGSCEGGGSLLEHSQLRGCHEPETAIRKQTSLIEHSAVNLVTRHPQDSPHPRHGVQEALPTQR
jgi:hypothetical protein